MNFNQILPGLLAKNTYRNVNWLPARFIKYNPDLDAITLYIDDEVYTDRWVPSTEELFSVIWEPVVEGTGPSAPLARNLFPLLEILKHNQPFGRAEYVEHSGGRNVARFNLRTESIEFAFFHSLNPDTEMKSDFCVSLMTDARWKSTGAIADSAPIDEVYEMSIKNKEEIVKLCTPLQNRLKANPAFVRVEIPVSDTGIMFAEREVSLLISISTEAVVMYLHSNGMLIESEEEFVINKHLVSGPISQRDAKPLSAIAVPKFIVRDAESIAVAERDGRVDALVGFIDNLRSGKGLPTVIPDTLKDDIRSIIDEFDTVVEVEPVGQNQFNIDGLPPAEVDLGYYRQRGLSTLFQVEACDRGLVKGYFLPITNGAVHSVASVDLFEIVFEAVPKVTNGSRLQLKGVGTQLVVANTDHPDYAPEFVLVKIDIGGNFIETQMAVADLEQDQWEFKAFEPQEK